MSSNNDEHVERIHERFDQPSSSRDVVTGVARQPLHDPMKKPCGQPPALVSLQRSDSELERIIDDLREKISRQHRIEEAKRQAAVDASAALDSSRSTNSSNSEQPLRKHLKNPLERMLSNHPTDMTGLNSLKRQQSANLGTRPQSAASGMKSLPPEVIATSITASLVSASSSSTTLTRPTALGGSAGVPMSANRQLGGAEDQAEISPERVYDDEGMHIKSYAQAQDNGVTATWGHAPPHFRSSTAIGALRQPASSTAGSTQSKRRPRVLRASTATGDDAGSTSGFQLEMQRGNNDSDSASSSFGDDDDNPFFTRCALSPMGPWVSSAGRPELGSNTNPDGSNSPLSSARTEDELAELSPRTRLLWFSRCADSDAPSSPVSATLRQCRRSASHPGTFRPSSAALPWQSRPDGSKTPTPARCASAKGSASHKRLENTVTLLQSKAGSGPLRKKRSQPKAVKADKTVV